MSTSNDRPPAGHIPYRGDGKPGVVITGSSTGIGEACALEFDNRGFRVFAGVRSEAAAEALRRQSSERLTPVMIDVTDAEMIAAAAETVGAALGDTPLAGLVNNAGIVVAGPLEILPLEELRRQFEVNVIGQMAVTRAFLPRLRAGRGRIVNIGSVNGAVAPPYLGAYAASKYALEALSDALRGELRAWGIHVSIVEPDSTATPIWEKSFAAADRMAEGVPAETMELYRANLDRFRKAIERIARTSMPTRRVVRAVVHALTARRPKTRYFVTWRTRFSFKALNMVPDRIRDWILRRELGLP